MKDYRISLVISFVLKLKGDERIDGDGLWSCPSFMEVCTKRFVLVLCCASIFKY